MTEMASSSSSLGIIPRNKFKIWEIFRDVGPDGEEVLKTAKLVQVLDKKRALVVTVTDETYSFYYLDEGGFLITRIAKLCDVRVKEFVCLNIDTGLAITDEGSLYSWMHAFPSLSEPTSWIVEPRLIGGSLTGRKVHQVALTEERLVALTACGDVHHCYYDYNTDIFSEPVLIPKKNFDYQEIVSLASTDHLSVALTSNGELFQWERDNKLPHMDINLPKKVIVDTAPLKKVVAASHMIFTLTVEGTLYSGRFPPSESTAPIWKVVLENLKFYDITTSGTDGVVVAELMNNIRLALSCRGGIVEPEVLSISPTGTSLDELFAEISQSTYRTLWAESDPKPGTVGGVIGNLSVTKKNVDVAFSLEGKTISAHKLILTSRSDYFTKMFSNEWKEAKSGSCIKIKDTKYEIFEALLFYLYHDRVSFSKDEYENIFGLMMLADAHCADKIRHECEQILIQNITAENAVFLVRNAASANASDLERNVIRFILDNRLLDVNLTPEETIDLLGMETFHKIAMAALRRI